MTTDDAKQWVEWYFALNEENEEDANDFYSYNDDLFGKVIHHLCGCFDAISPALREERGLETYHDLWLDLVTNEILDCGGLYGHDTELDALYEIYFKDQFARRVGSPSKEGFRAWLRVWLEDNDLEGVMQSWPPKRKIDS